MGICVVFFIIPLHAVKYMFSQITSLCVVLVMSPVENVIHTHVKKIWLIFVFADVQMFVTSSSTTNMYLV